MYNLYEKIETLCKQYGMTYSQLAKELGWSPSVLSELKAGRTKMLSTKKLEAIADYFQIPFTDLLDREKTNESTPKVEAELIRSTEYSRLNTSNKKKVDEMIDMLLKLQSLD